MYDRTLIEAGLKTMIADAEKAQTALEAEATTEIAAIRKDQAAATQELAVYFESMAKRLRAGHPLTGAQLLGRDTFPGAAGRAKVAARITDGRWASDIERAYSSDRFDGRVREVEQKLRKVPGRSVEGLRWHLDAVSASQAETVSASGASRMGLDFKLLTQAAVIASKAAAA